VALLQPLCKGHFQRERALSQAKGTFVKESIVELAPGDGIGFDDKPPMLFFLEIYKRRTNK